MNFIELLKTQGQRVTKDKQSHVFRQGDDDRYLYFVQSGMLKAYYTSEEGKEFVKSFIATNDIICSLTSAYSKGACSFSLICLEDTELLKIPFSKLSGSSKEYHEIATNMVDVLLNFSMKKEKREYEFLCLSAEQRYRLLEKNSPEIVKKVTQNDIARYLGITPVALSRIKNR